MPPVGDDPAARRRRAAVAATSSAAIATSARAPSSPRWRRRPAAAAPPRRPERVAPLTDAAIAAAPNRISSKKLTCSRCQTLPGDVLGGERLDLHRVAKIGQAFDQAVFLLVGGTAIEVIGAKVLVHRPILEHVVDGGKNGCCDS